MIQTQLLRLDPPYQIISAGGRVGIQIATLIVTENKSENGEYAIDTHSHPVVNYALKKDVELRLMYDNNPDTDAHNEILTRLQPEGAVWNKVEIGDVKVLGLAGKENAPITLRKLIKLLPTENDPWSPPLLERHTMYDIMSLKMGFHSVGMKIDRNGNSPHINRDKQTLKLLLTYEDETPFVRVIIDDYDSATPSVVPVIFDVRLFDSKDSSSDDIATCRTIIFHVLRTLKNDFYKRTKFFFSHNCGTSLSSHEEKLVCICEYLTKAFNGMQ